MTAGSASAACGRLLAGGTVATYHVSGASWGVFVAPPDEQKGHCPELLPNLFETLDAMTWSEVEQVSPYLPLLGPNAVESLCGLLKSERKQTIEAVTRALAAIGDARAAQPLVAMMETQAGRQMLYVLEIR